MHAQGNRVLFEEDFEQIVLIPSGVESFALGAHFQGCLVFQEVLSDLAQGVDVLRAIVLADSAPVFPKGHVQGPVNEFSMLQWLLMVASSCSAEAERLLM